MKKNEEIISESNKNNNLELEVLIHIVDKDENRINPSCNRLKIPLQVKDITQTEGIYLSSSILNAVTSCLGRNELLHRLVRISNTEETLADTHNSADCKYAKLVAFPTLDCIESLNIPRIFQRWDHVSHHRLLSDQLPDNSDQNQPKGSKT